MPGIIIKKDVMHLLRGIDYSKIMKKTDDYDLKTPLILIRLLKSEIKFKDEKINILANEVERLREENRKLRRDIR